MTTIHPNGELVSSYQKPAADIQLFCHTGQERDKILQQSHFISPAGGWSVSTLRPPVIRKKLGIDEKMKKKKTN